jgi:hypothetical protein
MCACYRGLWTVFGDVLQLRSLRTRVVGTNEFISIQCHYSVHEFIKFRHRAQSLVGFGLRGQNMYLNIKFITSYFQLTPTVSLHEAKTGNVNLAFIVNLPINNYIQLLTQSRSLMPSFTPCLDAGSFRLVVYIVRRLHCLQR